MTNGTGFKQAPQLSAKDKFRDVYAQISNLQMAGRVSQMMVQRLLENGKAMGGDVGKLFQLVTELQYQFLALQKTLNLDVDAMNTMVGDMRLKDFDEAAVKEDAKEGLEEATTVSDNSTVTLTSVASDPDFSIFRSRIKLADSGSAELIQGLVGKSVGTKVKAKLNNMEHEVELLSIRTPKAVETVTPEVIAADIQVPELKAVNGNNNG